jgi:hypothetical protein
VTVGVGNASVLIQRTRELILIKIPFLVPYRLVGDSIQVLRVIHQHTELAGDW